MARVVLLYNFILNVNWYLYEEYKKIPSSQELDEFRCKLDFPRDFVGESSCGFTRNNPFPPSRVRWHALHRIISGAAESLAAGTAEIVGLGSLPPETTSTNAWRWSRIEEAKVSRRKEGPNRWIIVLFRPLRRMLHASSVVLFRWPSLQGRRSSIIVSWSQSLDHGPSLVLPWSLLDRSLVVSYRWSSTAVDGIFHVGPNHLIPSLSDQIPGISNSSIRTRPW